VGSHSTVPGNDMLQKQQTLYGRQLKKKHKKFIEIFDTCHHTASLSGNILCSVSIMKLFTWPTLNNQVQLVCRDIILHLTSWWLNGVVVRMLDLRLSRR